MMFDFIDYNPETGVFTWTKPRGRFSALVGSRAGALREDGYRQIKINGKYIKEHRLAWYLTFGEWPPCEIDHIDGNRSNNAIANLRPATKADNAHNRRLNKNSSTGVKGVSLHKQTGKYQATIMIGRSSVYLGLYETLGEAEEVVKAERERLHREFHNHG